MVLLAAPACGGDAPRAPTVSRAAPSVSTDVSPAPGTPAATPRPSPPLPPPIVLAALPGRGLAVADRGDVVFLDLAGRRVDRVRGADLAGNGGHAPVWVKRGRTYFRLDPERHTLVPFQRSRARRLMYGGEERWMPQLRPPRESILGKSGPAGHWRYAFERSDGTLLAQWSGECEVPTAYWKQPGERAEIVTGGNDPSAAPSSFALGWTDEGLAVVFLPQGACGWSARRPGIYLFSAPGARTLLYEIHGYAGAAMWQ